MWSKISNVLKPLTSSKEEPHSNNNGGEVMTKILEQHPNLSVFHHSNDSGPVGRLSVDNPSPSVHSKKNMFKRLSKPLLLKGDAEEMHLPSPVVTQVHGQTYSKRTNNSLDFNSSQTSTSSIGEKPKPQHQLRSSFDMLRPSPPLTNFMDTTRSVKDTRRRPSLDLLREGDGSPRSLRLHTTNDDKQNNSIDIDFLSLAQDKGHGNSVRSILRDKNTPGTGQNVRFFSKNEFKVITPDNSAALSDILLDKPQPPIPKDEEEQSGDHSVGDISDSPPSLTKVSKTRPKLAGLFAPLEEDDNDKKRKKGGANKENINVSLSLSNPASVAPPGDYSNLFDTSAQLEFGLEMPSFPPSGLDFNVDAQTFGSTSFDMSANDIDYVVRDENLDGQNRRGQMTSTPSKGDPKGKGKDREKEKEIDESLVDGRGVDIDVPVPSSAPPVLGDSIFHWKEKKTMATPSPVHERSQSFSFGQTVFYSMANKFGDSKSEEELELEAAYPSSDVRGNSHENGSPGGLPVPSPEGRTSSKTRMRAVSDSAFKDMLRISPKLALPEADINDESGTDLVVYSGLPSEPDPFSAHANTYYTPQVNIPATPPRGMPKHLRTTSKEENFIILLQTELALKSELCAQYETDLKARDELVEILGKKLGDWEREEGKRKGAIRGWRKKVQELERNCRLLEEAMDRSRQESLERSVMDEASGEALRMLHRQIQGLEGEKGDLVNREEKLRDEVEELEKLVEERCKDLEELKERLRRGDERERELKEGLKEAKDQIEMLGDCSVVLGGVDDEDTEREREQKESDQTQSLRLREMELVQEVEEMKAKIEWVEVEKRGLEEQVEGLTMQLKTKEEEWKVLKGEAEAQWERTERMDERVGELEKENGELLQERVALRGDVESLEDQVGSLEREWRESEERRSELEEETREVWRIRDEQEQERVKLEDCLQKERDAAEQLRADLHRTESRVDELEEEKRFANEQIDRLEENLRNRDEEVTKYTQRFVAGEGVAEHLREELSRCKREQERALSERARLLNDALKGKDIMERTLEDVVRSKVDVDQELKVSKEKEGRLVREVEELKRELKMAKMDSADKEVKIVQITKRAEREREDLVGIGIALESKQQELELIKRKLNVRGTGGSTPAPSSAKASHRRDSGVFAATPLGISRPSSAMSSEDAGSVNGDLVKKNSNDTVSVSVSKVALGKSSWANATPSLSSSTSNSNLNSSTKGSMGPPPARSRPSTGGTQTPTPTLGGRTGLVRSSSTSAFGSSTANASTNWRVGGRVTSPVPTPTRPMVIGGHRRGTSEKESAPFGKTKLTKSRSVVGGSSPIQGRVVEEVHHEQEDEKENMDLTEKTSTLTRRRNLAPALS